MPQTAPYTLEAPNAPNAPIPLLVSEYWEFLLSPIQPLHPHDAPYTL